MTGHSTSLQGRIQVWILAVFTSLGSLALTGQAAAATSSPGNGEIGPWNVKVTANPKNELLCLAQGIYFESRGESADGQLAVAEVIVNRVKSKHYPNTLCGVVYQGSKRKSGCQFSFTCDGAKDVAANQKSWQFAKDLALTLMQGQLNPVTRDATHYHNQTVNPKWASKLEKTVIIGKHIFYRLPQRTASR